MGGVFGVGRGGEQSVHWEAVEPQNTVACVCVRHMCVLSEGGVLGG